MGASGYIRNLRRQIGDNLLLCPAVAAVIPDRDGSILLQRKRDGGGWSLPAGGIEPGEDPETALRREVLEETGLIVRPRNILGVFGGKRFRHVYENGDQVEYTVVLYLCDVADRTNGPRDDETESLRYVARAEMPRLAQPYPLDVLFRHTTKRRRTAGP